MSGGKVQWGVVAVVVPIGGVRVEGLAQVCVAVVQLQGCILISILQVLAELGGATAHGGEGRWWTGPEVRAEQVLVGKP